MAGYDLGVECYDQLWGPVILPAAASLIPWLALDQTSLVLDVGGGTGALAHALGSAAPGSRVVVLDASREMLRVAHVRRELAGAQADAASLPIADQTADAVVMAYVLFHLGDPLVALQEARRVLRPEGRVGTVTWIAERAERAQLVWNDALTAAGVPALPPRRVDTGLDSPDALDVLLRQAGLRPQHMWRERLSHQWDPQSFWALVTGSGVNRQRLGQLDPQVCTDLLHRLRNQLGRLSPEDYLWHGDVLCTVATNPAGRQ